MRYNKLSHYILSLLLSSALLCGCNRHPMAAMSEEEHAWQESAGGATILESGYLEAVDSEPVPATTDVAQEASVHGLSVNVNLVVGDSVGQSELASIVRDTGLDEVLPSVARVENVDETLEDNCARKKVIGQQNAALLAGAAALGGYVTNSLFTWHSASKQQEKCAQEHEKLANRIRTLEEALSLPAVIDVDTTPITQASDATCVSGTRLFVSPSVSVSQAVPVGLCTLLAGRYIARKIQCYRTALAVALRTKTFGEAEWKHYFGDVESAPPLPSDMAAILDGPCPFWPDQLVKDTHLLVLIPATVGGVPFTLNLLEELIKHPSNGGHSTKYSFYHMRVKGRIGEQSPPRSYWLLMTRDVLPGSLGKVYADQKELVADYASREGVSYALPSVLEAATAILMHHAREGDRLFGNDPWTQTRCQEVWGINDRYPATVGALDSWGLWVDCNIPDYSKVGAACCRKF